MSEASGLQKENSKFIKKESAQNIAAAKKLPLFEHSLYHSNNHQREPLWQWAYDTCHKVVGYFKQSLADSTEPNV